MTETIDYYLAMQSPWSYLGGARLAEIAARAGANVVVHPVRLGDVFARTGGLPLPKRSPERQAYRLAELRRWRDHLGLTVVLEPTHFPVDESLAAHVTLAAREMGGDALGFSIAIGRSLWEQDRNLADPAVIAAAAASVGLDLDATRASEAFANAGDLHAAETDAAVARGVFAVPTYIVGEELYWGQDRLDFVARQVGA